VTRESVVTNVGRGGNERFSKIIGDSPGLPPCRTSLSAADSITWLGG
jgi:hypothetical protein